MAAVYNSSQARQNFAALLEQAVKEGEVRIRRRDGQIFVIRPEPPKESPLRSEERRVGKECRSRWSPYH